jgi:uncharacterized membrane protein YgcG
VVTVASLEGEESFDYSMRLARSWGIGSPENDTRGLLILVAVTDRKTAFRTSRHIESELPDGVTGDIGRQMNAYFKSGDFGGGLSLGLGKVLDRLGEVYEPQEVRKSGSAGRLVWLIVALGFGAGFGALLLIAWRSRRWVQGRGANVAENRRNYFAFEKQHTRQTGQKTRQQKEQRQQQRRRQKEEQERRRRSQRASPTPAAYDSSSSDYDRSSSSSSNSSSSGSDTSSSYDYGSSSSSSDSGSSYSGGSDFGGGGSDSSW